MMAYSKEDHDPGPESAARSPAERPMATSADGGGENPDQLLGLYCSSLHRKCSNCGRTGHNSRTCLESRTAQPSGASQPLQSRDNSGPGDSTISLEKDEDEFTDTSGQRGKPKEGRRKKGVAWTEEEHKKFLDGLKKLGKGNWRGISRHFVKSKTPTQVASHAQKHFLRQTVPGKRKRRSSLFDVVLENEQGREAAQSTAGTDKPTGASDSSKVEPNNAKASGTEPQIVAPEALWSYWYQNMMMQQNPMAWMPTLMGAGHPSRPPDHTDAPQVVYQVMPGVLGPLPGMMFSEALEGVPDGRNSSAMAAYLAQENQAAAMMAYMPQLSEYLGRCAAEVQIRATQAAQAAAAANVPHPDRHRETEATTDNTSGIGNPNFSGSDEDFPSRPSKLTIPSNSESRLDLSNDSTQTEEYGNGELVRPQAKKAKSFLDLPNWRLDSGSLPNSPSKQSQSTQVAERFGRALPMNDVVAEAQTLSSNAQLPVSEMTPFKHVEALPIRVAVNCSLAA